VRVNSGEILAEQPMRPSRGVKQEGAVAAMVLVKRTGIALESENLSTTVLNPLRCPKASQTSGLTSSHKVSPGPKFQSICESTRPRVTDPDEPARAFLVNGCRLLEASPPADRTARS
jgi:hypothetical protein